jgi:hypothetical protein
LGPKFKQSWRKDKMSDTYDPNEELFDEDEDDLEGDPWEGDH